ncbi:unnamed protein product [Diamesa hyperborea]
MDKPKRSPLATVSMNKASCSYQQYTFPGQSTRTPSKVADRIISDHYKNQQQKIALGVNNHFNKLSDEIILEILQWLPKKSLMKCLILDTRFNRIVQDDTLWIRMDLGNKALKPGSIGKIFAKSFLILRLAQAKIASPLFEPSLDLNSFTTKLQYLDLSLASIEVASLQQLLSVCRSLKKLSLEHVNVDLSVCQQIAQNRQLEALNLGMCNGLTTDGIKYICKYLKNLSSLNISWTNIRLESVECIVAKLSPTVTRLNMAGCRNTCYDHHLSVLVLRCPNLVELDVSDCTMLSSATIQIVSQLKKLEYLSLSRCYNITMTSYLALNQIDSLLYLDVFGLLSDAGLGMIEKTFKNIGINKFIHSSVARPTVTPRRTSIWGLRTRD